VILIYPTNEKDLKHNMVDCLSRCKLHLRVIVLDNVDPDKTLLQILEEWKNNELVQIYDEDYLKNADKLELQKFEHLLKKDEQHQIFNIDDPILRQSLQSFQRTQIDRNVSEEIDLEAATKASTLTFYERIWLNEISMQINDWKLFGRIIGVEQYELDEIDVNYQKKYEKAYQCISIKIGKSTEPLNWSYWKEKLLTSGEGGIVDIIEEKHPYTIGSRALFFKDMSSYPMRYVFDMMCTRIKDWRQFAEVLGLDYRRRDFKKVGVYNETYENIYTCIVKTIESTVDGYRDWNYWRNILLRINEKELIDEIEHKYPKILQDDLVHLSDAFDTTDGGRSTHADDTEHNLIERSSSVNDVNNSTCGIFTYFIIDRMKNEGYGIPHVLKSREILIKESEIARSFCKIADTIAGDKALNDLISGITVTKNTVYKTFFTVAKEIFQDGTVNWGRIVMLFYFAYKLTVSLLSQGQLIDEVIEWVAKFVSDNLSSWISSRGGWPSINEYFNSTSVQTVGVFLAGVLVSLLFKYKS